MRTFSRVFNVGRLRVCLGNEDAPTGDRIAFYVMIHWNHRQLFNNYRGG